MEYIEGTIDFKLNNTCVTLGKFDGIHRGHELLIDRLVQEKSLKKVMFTFNYHPSNLFSGKGIDLIFTERERRFYLEEKGQIDVLISYPFGKETANVEAEDFVRDVLVAKLDAKVIVVGTDYRFGKNRKGDVELLKSLQTKYGFKVIACEKVKQDKDIISSTLIRSELEKGNLERAALLLGRSFSVIGTVIHGKQIGRKLDFPTANIIPPSNKLLPPDGVYFTRMKVYDDDGCIAAVYPCISNIGTNPTVNSNCTEIAVRTLESFVLSGSVELYDRRVVVELLHFKRAEKKFESLAELKNQIAMDSAAARVYFAI